MRDEHVQQPVTAAGCLPGVLLALCRDVVHRVAAAGPQVECHGLHRAGSLRPGCAGVRSSRAARAVAAAVTTVAAASTTTLPAQLGGTDVDTSPLSLWNSGLSAARRARPQLMSAPVTTAMHAVSTAIGITCGRSSLGARSARRRIAITAHTLAAAAATPSSAMATRAAMLATERTCGGGYRLATIFAMANQPITAAGGTSSSRIRSARRPVTACLTTLQASGSAPASTATPARMAAARRMSNDAPMAAFARAAAWKSGYSVIFWKPTPAMVKTTTAQATVAIDRRIRSGMVLPPGGFRRASSAPEAALTIRRARAARDDAAARAVSSAANSSP